MKKLYIVLLCAIILVGTASLILIGIQDPDSQKETGSDIVTTGFKFTVKEYNGRVAVFDYGGSTPIEVLDCPLSTLPQEEAEQLKAGIDVSNEYELQRLIEAFD